MGKRIGKQLLTSWEIWQLDRACNLIHDAFDGPMCGTYLVGSAEKGNDETRYRDVDVRLMLDTEEFNRTCPTRARWELLCISIGAYLRQQTGLPIDFQIQRTDLANERYGGHARNALGGMGRVYAAGGDATPFDVWDKDIVAPKESEENEDA